MLCDGLQCLAARSALTCRARHAAPGGGRHRRRGRGARRRPSGRCPPSPRARAGARARARERHARRLAHRPLRGRLRARPACDPGPLGPAAARARGERSGARGCARPRGLAADADEPALRLDGREPRARRRRRRYRCQRALGSARRAGRERAGRACLRRLRRRAAMEVTPLLSLPGELVVPALLVELGGILVNQGGRRFADETGEALGLARAVRAQPGRVAYLLFDERIAAAAREADPFFARVVLPRTARRAATLAELARQFELDVEHLERTVDTYDANLELGGDPFGREPGGAPLAPPFYAIRVTGARRRTLGGLAVDARARVLDVAGRPIPGLYAVGGAAAGLGGEGTEGALAGTAALAALGLGRLAALDVGARDAAE